MSKRVLLALAVAFAVSVSASGAGAQDRTQIDARLADIREQIAAAREKEAALSSDIADVTSRIRALESEVGDVSGKLEALEADLALHQEKLDRLTELFLLQTQRLRFLKRQHAEAMDRLNRRIVDLYESEEIGALDVVLSAASFTDALDQLDYLREIGSQDRRIARQVGTAKTAMRELRKRTAKTKVRVEAVTRAIAVRTAQARAVRDRLLARQSGLSTARSNKRATLEDIREHERHLAQEEAELTAMSAQLAATIMSAQSVPTVAVVSGTPSASGFIWPVGGPVVSPFGLRWGRMHEGIDIAAPYGAGVVAAAAGTVIVSGWMGGYGNLVVIDHGGGIATAYAHLSSFGVGSGQPVGQGQFVGAIGCTGQCFGPHLHFEVRVNGYAVDPLGYL